MSTAPCDLDGDGVRRPRSSWRLALTLLIAIFTMGVSWATAPRFTVVDDIEMTTFTSGVLLSPDGNYLAVSTEKGVLITGRLEATLRLYRMADLKVFLRSKAIAPEPAPIWVIAESIQGEGPAFTAVQWLADSSALAFLKKLPSGYDQLVVGDVRGRSLEALTPDAQHVTAYDIRDRDHYVYAVLSSAIERQARTDSTATAINWTGRPFYNLAIPEELYPAMAQELHDRSDLWAVINGARFRVNSRSGEPLPLFSEGLSTLRLSPDGLSVVAAFAVADVPQEWTVRYQPPKSQVVFAMRAGSQDLQSLDGYSYVSQVRSIDLRSGDIQFSTNAPTAQSAGWFEAGRSEAWWSPDGKVVVVSNTFTSSQIADSQGQAGIQHPCAATAVVQDSVGVCLDKLNSRDLDSADAASGAIQHVGFLRNPRGVAFDYKLPNGATQTLTYTVSPSGVWSLRGTTVRATTVSKAPRVYIKEDLNNAPELVGDASPASKSIVIWDPNKRLRSLDLGTAAKYEWTDKTGRDSRGVIYFPPDFDKGRRYPVVIQTHGYRDLEFIPSGIYPTAFAARALAAAGIVVLQVGECPLLDTTQEASCNVALFDGAVDRLVGEGVADANRIGIIGFSRTCYHVMDALTTSTHYWAAASITDGVTFGYMQYLLSVDWGNGSMIREAEATLGSAPFGEGLNAWATRSWEARIEKVITPLQIVAIGRLSALFDMWEPYAGLRSLNKPVDFVVIQHGSHVLSNPSARLVSQGGTIDWFRFWLQDIEDSDPAKAEQYVRWRELRKLQTAQNAERAKAEQNPTAVH